MDNQHCEVIDGWIEEHESERYTAHRLNWNLLSSEVSYGEAKKMEDGIKTRLRSASHASEGAEAPVPQEMVVTHLPPPTAEGGPIDPKWITEEFFPTGFRLIKGMESSTECLKETLDARREMHEGPDDCEVSSTEDEAAWRCRST